MSVQASQQITITDITDAYYVALTSEAYTFMGNTSGAPSGLSCTTQAVAYCGTKVCSKVTIGSITCPTGISAAITNNNTVSPTITFKTTGTITASCEAIIPISVDGVTINKKFSFAVAKTGATGEKGDKGNTGAAGQDGEDGQMLYATCSTAAGTKAKTAALSSGTLSLKTGSTVSVKFTYANTAASPTLNVAGTGAKTIRVNGATMTAAYYWVAGAVITFVYDGTYWNVSDAGALKKVEDAAKTATNFLKFENNGLIVGNMTGSTLGNNVLIDSDSVDIRNGDTVLASYGADVIYLGKGKKDTMIDICDGTGIIKRDVYENTDYFVVGRNNPSNNPNIYFATNEIGIRMYGPSSVSYDDGKEAIIRMFGTKGSGTISIMSDIIDISGWTVNINGHTDVKVNGDSLISKLNNFDAGNPGDFNAEIKSGCGISIRGAQRGLNAPNNSLMGIIITWSTGASWGFQWYFSAYGDIKYRNLQNGTISQWVNK